MHVSSDEAMFTQYHCEVSERLGVSSDAAIDVLRTVTASCSSSDNWAMHVSSDEAMLFAVSLHRHVKASCN